MLRASLFILATAVLVPLSVIVACNDVETTPAPDAGKRTCNAGPFVFDDDGNPAVGLGAKPAGAACSADGTNLEVINLLPRGGWYPLGWKVQTSGLKDESGQGECSVITVCNCVEATTPAPEPDAAPAPSPSGPVWKCG